MCVYKLSYMCTTVAKANCIARVGKYYINFIYIYVYKRTNIICVYTNDHICVWLWQQAQLYTYMIVCIHTFVAASCCSLLLQPLVAASCCCLSLQQFVAATCGCYIKLVTATIVHIYDGLYTHIWWFVYTHRIFTIVWKSIENRWYMSMIYRWYIRTIVAVTNLI